MNETLFRIAGGIVLFLVAWLADNMKINRFLCVLIGFVVGGLAIGLAFTFGYAGGD